MSSETLLQLNETLVEGNLLPVDIDEQRSLHQVLVACDSDSYGVKVLEFEVSFPAVVLSLSASSCRTVRDVQN